MPRNSLAALERSSRDSTLAGGSGRCCRPALDRDEPIPHIAHRFDSFASASFRAGAERRHRARSCRDRIPDPTPRRAVPAGCRPAARAGAGGRAGGIHAATGGCGDPRPGPPEAPGPAQDRRPAQVLTGGIVTGFGSAARPDPGQQFGDGERLGHEIDRATVQHPHPRPVSVTADSTSTRRRGRRSSSVSSTASPVRSAASDREARCPARSRPPTGRPRPRSRPRRPRTRRPASTRARSSSRFGSSSTSSMRSMPVTA